MRNVIVAFLAVVAFIVFANVAEAKGYDVIKTKTGYQFSFYKVPTANGKTVTGNVDIVTDSEISKENLHYVHGAIAHYFGKKLNASSNEITRIGQTGRIIIAVFKAALKIDVSVANNRLYL